MKRSTRDHVVCQPLKHSDRITRNSGVEEAAGFGLSMRGQRALRRLARKLGDDPSLAEFAAMNYQEVRREIGESRVFGELRDLLHVVGLDFVGAADFDPIGAREKEITAEQGMWKITSIRKRPEGLRLIVLERGDYRVPILVDPRLRAQCHVGQRVRLAMQPSNAEELDDA